MVEGGDKCDGLIFRRKEAMADVMGREMVGYDKPLIFQNWIVHGHERHLPCVLNQLLNKWSICLAGGFLFFINLLQLIPVFLCGSVVVVVAATYRNGSLLSLRITQAACLHAASIGNHFFFYF